LFARRYDLFPVFNARVLKNLGFSFEKEKNQTMLEPGTPDPLASIGIVST